MSRAQWRIVCLVLFVLTAVVSWYVEFQIE